MRRHEFTSAGGPRMDSRTGSKTRPFRVPMTINMDSTTKKYLQTTQACYHTSTVVLIQVKIVQHYTNHQT